MSELNPIPPGALPQASTASAAASKEEMPSPARDSTHPLQPPLGGLSSAPSPPGVGRTVDIYDTKGLQGLDALGDGKGMETLSGILNSEFTQGLATATTIVPPPDFPYLKPLGSGLGQAFNALV